MDTMTAYAMGQASRGNKRKVFDWDKAARIIADRGAQDASAGLAGDWEWTGGPILSGGEPVPAEDTYTYLASTWATPELSIDGEQMDCWRYRQSDDDWEAETYWPESALAILHK